MYMHTRESFLHKPVYSLSLSNYMLLFEMPSKPHTFNVSLISHTLEPLVQDHSSPSSSLLILSIPFLEQPQQLEFSPEFLPCLHGAGSFPLIF